MSKMTIMAVMFLVITAASAFSTPISSYMDLGVVDASLGGYTNDGNTTTGVFNQIGYYANLNTTQYDTTGPAGYLSVGDVYLTDGHVYSNGFIGSTSVDNEGMNVRPYFNGDTTPVLINPGGYELTFVLTDLVGVVDDIAVYSGYDYVTNRYTGGRIDMYIDASPDYNFGTDGSDLKGDTGFNDGVRVATIENIRGIGTSTFEPGTVNTPSPDFRTGSYDIEGTFTHLLDDFWYRENGEDLHDTLFNLSWLMGVTDGNVDKINQEFDPNTHLELAHEEYGKVLYTIDSDSDASLELSAVPEPATCLLLGTGLLGLSGITRRRFKK